MASFELKDFRVTRNKKEIFSPISLNVGMGSFIAVLGNNGAGKTSLLQGIVGELNSLGSCSSIQPQFYLRQHQHLVFDLSVMDVLLAGLHQNRLGLTVSEKKEKALLLLEAWSLSDLSDKQFLELSGGQQQLIWVLQAIISEPKLLLLDEPTQYLDVRNIKLLYDKMFAYAKDKSALVLCSCHDVEKLQGREGYLLNISAPKVGLERISKESITANLNLLIG